MNLNHRLLTRPKLRRLIEHLIFWIIALALLTFYFGADKPNYLIPLRNNLFYLPVHIGYFYFLAYYLIPKYLYTRKYLLFFVSLIGLILGAGFFTRLMDIFFVDPYLFKIQKEMGIKFTWDKMEGDFLDKLQKPYYFVNAIKGSNLIVWIALSIKFFKMWYERRQAAMEAELNFLKGQIHPHFLFNTLNNLYSLTIQMSPKSPFIVMGLSDILRYMLYECNTDSIALKREIELIESYIALEKIRYDNRLELNLSISGSVDDIEIAPLLMLPLVENAFKHGVGEKVGDAWINIDLKLKSNILKLKISNSKPEFFSDNSEKNKGNIGLANLKKRLEILYPNAYDLKLFDEQDMFLAVLEIQTDKHIVFLS
jgi:hypothetical protein